MQTYTRVSFRYIERIRGPEYLTECSCRNLDAGQEVQHFEAHLLPAYSYGSEVNLYAGSETRLMPLNNRRLEYSL